MFNIEVAIINSHHSTELPRLQILFIYSVLVSSHNDLPTEKNSDELNK